MFGVLYGKRFGLEMASAIRTEGERVRGAVQSTETSCEGPGLHIKFRRRGITQKKAYNIQDKAKV